ncbi:MAG TPA: hypothetical protein DCP32_06115 [Anaerolineaceae bacterium]|nr:hypothetical protein [Anaerolineaceae bacterium]
MEGAQPDTLHLSRKQRFEPVLHLAGGFVGEGDRQDVFRAHAHMLDQVSDALGQNASLAGTGTGQD